jgi:hypothetical protein
VVMKLSRLGGTQQQPTFLTLARPSTFFLFLFSFCLFLSFNSRCWAQQRWGRYRRHGAAVRQLCPSLHPAAIHPSVDIPTRYNVLKKRPMNRSSHLD